MVKSAPFSSIALRHYDKPINYLLHSFIFRKSMKIPKEKTLLPLVSISNKILFSP